MQFPSTRISPVSETVHGVSLTDNYRWLEDQQSSETNLWIAEQNAFTRSVLDKLPYRNELRERIKCFLDVGFVYAPTVRNDKYFYTRRSAGQNQAVLVLRQGEQERILIDPNTFEGDGTTTLDWFNFSDDGNFLAYGLSEGGTEMSTLYLLDIANDARLDDTIPRTRYSAIAWLPDNSGFYYTRYPTPGTVPPGEENYHRKLYFHKIGDSWEDDPLVYQDADPQAMLSVDISPDGRYLLVGTSIGWSKVTLYLRDLFQENNQFIRLTGEETALYAVEMTKDGFYIHTNHNAPRYKILKGDYENPIQANWREIVPEGKHAIQQMKIAAKRLAVHTLENAISRLHLYSLEGEYLHEVKMPEAGAITSVNGKQAGDEIFFDLTGFTLPVTAYRYQPEAQNLEVFTAPTMPDDLDLSQVTTRQVWYKSKDGTEISMFIVHNDGIVLDGNNPTMLTGYGGFNISRTPAFFADWLVWLEKGGVCALPNLRGGGEYGEEWHKAGMLGNKQNVFDDFIGAAEWLIANNYTNKDKLAIYGGSNGGLLVGAALTQRPDLYKAVVCAVPLLDMVRYHQFLIARLWIPEYGSSEDPEHFKWLYAYSPYHKVNEALSYPAVLFTTAEGDSRVDPNHACKMTALLQAVAAKQENANPVLLRVEDRAGHGVGKPVYKVAEERADVWSFIMWQLKAI
jgi:prolyl oligopeptidase